MLGLLLLDFATQQNISFEKGDQLFLAVATHHSMPIVVVLLFVLGLIAAAYSSADSALTSMTTSFSIDILNIKKKPEPSQLKYRKITHILFSVLLALVILIFRYTIDDSVIKELFIMAGYTYGPLLGLYSVWITKSTVGQGQNNPIHRPIISHFLFYFKDYGSHLVGLSIWV